MKRLNKFITDAGYCSRREADRYIAEGRVTVNGADARVGDMVEDGDLVEVDGERVGKAAKRPVYIAFNKPVGVSSTSDPADPTNIIDFIGYKERIFHVGRLDKDSEGLIILTNDGDIVNKILRAGNNNPKEYVVTVDKPLTAGFLDTMARGVKILGTTTKPAKVFRRNDTTFVIHLTQGLNRQIRRMCEALGYKVVGLKRIKVMNISLGSLEPGRWRYFTGEEIRQMHTLLTEASGTEEASDRPAPRRRHKSETTGGNRSTGKHENTVAIKADIATKGEGRNTPKSKKKSAVKAETGSTGNSKTSFSQYRKQGKPGSKPSKRHM